MRSSSNRSSISNKSSCCHRCRIRLLAKPVVRVRHADLLQRLRAHWPQPLWLLLEVMLEVVLLLLVLGCQTAQQHQQSAVAGVLLPPARCCRASTATLLLLLQRPRWVALPWLLAQW